MVKITSWERQDGHDKYGFRLGFLEENDESKGFVRSIRNKQPRGTPAPGSGRSPGEGRTEARRRRGMGTDRAEPKEEEEEKERRRRTGADVKSRTINTVEE